LWGAWFAVIFDHAEGCYYVCRDPTAHLPLYRLDHNNQVLLATHIELFEAAGAPPPKVSWPDLAAQLTYPEMRQARTCLSGVREVAPGTMERIGGSEPHQQRLWSAGPHGSRPSATREQAADALRKTTITCVAGWARATDRVAVSASGGLDSSIVCAALAAASEPFDCVTVSTPDASGDESAYVGLLAQHFGVRMIHRTFNPAAIDLTWSASAGLPRPTRKAFMVELQRHLREAADQLGATAIFDGNGGDNLFCFLHSAAPIIDRLQSEGFGRGIFQTFLDMCRITDCDVGTMAQAVLSIMRHGTREWQPDNRLLAWQVGRQEPLTPWLGDADPRVPGKAKHIELLLRAQNFTHGLSGSAPPLAFSPLLSQPLLELCLAVPSWLWCSGGVNRSLAREAFRDNLPVTILARRSKAGPESVLRAVFRRNRELIREMLLGGVLADRGIIDIKAVELALQVDEQADDPIINRLLDLAEAEAWARSWG